MRILGIDPGIGRTGWGIVDSNGNRLKTIAFNLLETPAHTPTVTRLSTIFHTINSLLDTYSPDALAIEELFFNNNAKTAMVVGQARGVIMLAAEEKGIPLVIYTPLQVKIAITGYGRAEKAQIGQMIKMLLGLEKIPKPDDVADALAIAITHAFSYKLAQKKI